MILTITSSTMMSAIVLLVGSCSVVLFQLLLFFSVQSVQMTRVFSQQLWNKRFNSKTLNISYFKQHTFYARLSSVCFSHNYNYLLRNVHLNGIFKHMFSWISWKFIIFYLCFLAWCSGYFLHVANYLRASIAYIIKTMYWCNYFLYLWLTPHNAEQSLKGMELQEKGSDQKHMKAD